MVKLSLFVDIIFIDTFLGATSMTIVKPNSGGTKSRVLKEWGGWNAKGRKGCRLILVDIRTFVEGLYFIR